MLRQASVPAAWRAPLGVGPALEGVLPGGGGEPTSGRRGGEGPADGGAWEGGGHPPGSGERAVLGAVRSAVPGPPPLLWVTMSAAGYLPSQLRDQRLLSRESAPPQPRDHSLSASLPESVIHLISTCLQVEECLLSRANCISHPGDLRLLSPAMNAYSAARSVLSAA